MHCPYSQELAAVLPRILSFFDRDKWSATFGVADRQHVSWCTTDFANGTQQGAAHGLARLLAAGMLPEWCPREEMLSIIQSAFDGTRSIMRPNGSMEEAFPMEASFCVTALVAHDLLWASRLLPDLTDADKAYHIETVKPLISFLLASDETHGCISNHLATAVGALLLWHAATGDQQAEKRAKELLERILDHSSHEGWFKEYDGADPGYQTLCLHYLTLADSIRPDLGLQPFLVRAAQFLSYFAFPDGSFGGVFGSRRTRLWFPSGIAMLAEESDTALSLSRFMKDSIARHGCVTLTAMDDPNLIPLFNSYAIAAEAERLVPAKPRAPLPCIDDAFEGRHFPEAGLLVCSTPHHYTVVSPRLGGAYESCSKDGQRHRVDGGSIVTKAGKHWSTQTQDPAVTVSIGKDAITVTTRVSPLLRTRPTPIQLMGLRVLALTVMRIAPVSRAIKNCMAFLLIGRKQYLPLKVIRRIIVAGELAETAASLEPANASVDRFVPEGGDFRSIHMASAGYWHNSKGSEQ